MALRTEEIKEFTRYTINDSSNDYKIVRIWESINECGRNGFDRSHIIECCHGKRKTHNGFIWSFKKIEKC